MTGHIRRYVIPAAYDVLPAAMASAEATVMLLAIGYQESRFEHRKQIGGPARGYWQFEQGGGVRGVLGHQASRMTARIVLEELGYPGEPTTWGVYDALAHNDVLACCFARLLLWTLPDPLPSREDPDVGWDQYVAAWRPGRPHPRTWPEAWALACAG